MPTASVSQRHTDPFFRALLVLALLALPAAAQEKRLMEAGRSIEQKLKGGENHVYRIEVQKGQFLRVVLEERGIDLVLVLVGPDGKTVVEADSLNYRWGREPASMIAESSGIHQVRVESRDENEPVGSYEIELTDLRAPTPADQTRIAAERALFKAKKLSGNRATQSNAIDAREAISYYEKALSLWREVGDRYEEGLALYSAAFLYDRLGDHHKALAALHDGKQYMVEKYRNEVFTQKSIGTLSGEHPKTSWRVLGMGVSKAHGELPELPAVRDELQGIVRTEAISPKGLLPGKLLLDEAFTEEDVVKSLEMRFPVVHIASHFAFRAGDEENSFLLLGRSGDVAEADRLSLRRIRIDQAIRFRNTELLTLSACDTATSGSSNGQEVDGLADIAQEKGAKAVLASLWEVDDESTGLLMKKFYEFWTRQPATPKAEALRQAQLALLQGKVMHTDSAKSRPQDRLDKSYSAPYFWAPFVLFGNWQ